MFKSVIKILTLSCEESRQLRERELDEKLKWVDRLALSGHQLSCKICRRLRKQLNQIDVALRTLPQEPKTTMPLETRSRIEQQIKSVSESSETD